ncbi:MAG TPA: site-specific DNA-methyltransferase [Polyangiaceae bacterium]|nr:site-specific DNA-methyltransferase [Polyangiaceae bacterium]
MIGPISSTGQIGPDLAPRLGGLRTLSPLSRTAFSADGVEAPALRWIRGDNALALGALVAEQPAQVTLAYLDPPFLTGRQHLRVERRKTQNNGFDRRLRPAFDDRWKDSSEYLSALGTRIELVRALLAPHGSIIVHVDPKTSHYVKVLCDEIFGADCFASEIIWRYRRWPAKTPNFQRLHDVLLRYVRDDRTKPRFNQLYEPLAPSTQATWGSGKQQAVIGEHGRRRRSSTLPEQSPGAPLGDVWDIGIVAPVARERTGYPTQKPEALMERLILSLSDPGELVLDPYGGSGTTLAVAARHGRRAIGIDSSPESWSVAEDRLRQLGELWTQEVGEQADGS